MAQIEFEALVENGMIRIPKAVADRLSEGTSLRVSVVEIEPNGFSMTREEAWAAVGAFIQERMSQPAPADSYQWHREDAYEHLNDQNSTD